LGSQVNRAENKEFGFGLKGISRLRFQVNRTMKPKF
jgi:hypothetical protein